jgi:hypothetical protein
MFLATLFSGLSWFVIVGGLILVGFLFYIRKALPAWAWIAIVAGILLDAQHFRMQSVEVKYANTLKDVAEKTKKAKVALIQYQEAVRVSESNLKSGFEARMKGKIDELAKIQSLYRAAVDNAGGMRNQSDRIVAQYDPSNRNPAIASNVASAYEAIRVYAGLFNEANRHATEVAKFAEQSYSAAEGCFADYEHARREIELFNKSHQPARMPSANKSQ